MPMLKRPDGEIYYQEYGQGYPILLFAPGGMRSRSDNWHSPADGPPRNFSDWTQSLADSYRVIAMDQRNAGRSRTAIEADHGWHTYAADHLALMDHLGFQRFHTLGGCIGGSFCLKLCEMVPDRITAAVLQNPIGLHPDFPEYFPESFVEWTSGTARRTPGTRRSEDAFIRPQHVERRVRVLRQPRLREALSGADIPAARQ